MTTLSQLDTRIAELLAVRAAQTVDTPAEECWELEDELAELRARRAKLFDGGNGHAV